jgi:hypothetical protein
LRQSVNGQLSTGGEGAESLAIDALGFLAAEPERLSRFLDLSGLGPHNLRQAATSPGFLAAVLDHLAADERLLLAFAAAQGIEPGVVAGARDRLAGRPPDSFP